MAQLGRSLRGGATVALGSAISGVLAYGFFAMVTRALGATAAAPVSVLWAWWGFAGAAITFPIQHWVARTATAHGERTVRSALSGVRLAIAAMALIVVLLSFLLRGPLFGGRDGTAYALLAGGVTMGSGVMGLARGLLTARGQLGAVGAGLVAENALRVASAAVLLTTGVTSALAYGGCLVAGYLAVIGFPDALRPRSTGERDVGVDGWVAVLGGTSAAQLISQAVLTGGPVLLALAGGSAHEVTALFAGLALFRAPYMLALGALAALTATVTRMVVRHDDVALARLRRGVVRLVTVGALIAVPIGQFAGPPLLKLLFGDSVVLASGRCVLLAVGSVFAIGSLVITVMVVAHHRGAGLLRAWLIAVVVGGIAFAAGPGGLSVRTCLAFLITEALAFALLVREERSARPLGS